MRTMVHPGWDKCRLIRILPVALCLLLTACSAPNHYNAEQQSAIDDARRYYDEQIALLQSYQPGGTNYLSGIGQFDQAEIAHHLQVIQQLRTNLLK
jgi:outer membrane biogenesis lipoprotein LolB